MKTSRRENVLGEPSTVLNDCVYCCVSLPFAHDQVEGANDINPLSAELNPICYLLALLGVHHFLHVSRIRVKPLGY